MYVRDVAGGVEVLTPAKLNLFLEVLSRRDDGFHEIQSLIVPINLFDHLSFREDSRGDLNLTCQWACGLDKRGRVIKPTQSPLPEWESLPEGNDNIAVRAVDLLRRRAGITAGASLHLIKRIPTAAGLGGGSSDAAAALVAANRAWKLDWPAKRLSQTAAEVGSDVPFFLGANRHCAKGAANEFAESREPDGSILSWFVRRRVWRPPTFTASVGRRRLRDRPSR